MVKKGQEDRENGRRVKMENKSRWIDRTWSWKEDARDWETVRGNERGRGELTG